MSSIFAPPPADAFPTEPSTPGTYTFTAQNDDGTTHALEIEGPASRP